MLPAPCRCVGCDSGDTSLACASTNETNAMCNTFQVRTRAQSYLTNYGKSNERFSIACIRKNNPNIFFRNPCLPVASKMWYTHPRPPLPLRVQIITDYLALAERAVMTKVIGPPPPPPPMRPQDSVAGATVVSAGGKQQPALSGAAQLRGREPAN